MATCIGTMFTLCAIPMAATASAPKPEVKLFSTVIPVTFSRFWMEDGIPTMQTPTTMIRLNRTIRGERET